jgi:hypothetical protein
MTALVQCSLYGGVTFWRVIGVLSGGGSIVVARC